MEASALISGFGPSVVNIPEDIRLRPDPHLTPANGLSALYLGALISAIQKCVSFQTVAWGCVAPTA